MVGFERLKHKTMTVNPRKSANPTRSGKQQKRRNSSGSKAKKRHANPKNPDLFTLGVLNPRGGSMAKQQQQRQQKRKKGRVPAALAQYLKGQNRTKNPQAGNGQKRRKGHRARNPNITNRTIAVLKNGALALAGLLATRQIPQLVLQGHNTSYVGWLANLTVALVSAGVANSIMRGAAAPVLIGGGLYLVDRILTEQFSSAGQILSLSGVGDAKVATNGTRGLSGVRTGYFPLPVQYNDNGTPIIPQAIIDAAQRGMMPAAQAAAAAAGGNVRAMRGPGYPNRASGNRLIAA